MTFALRHLLPGGLLVIGLLMAVFYYVVILPQLNTTTTQTIANYAQVATRTIQGRLNADFLSNPDSSFPIEIFNTAALPATRGLYIIDASGQVLYAHRSRFIGLDITELDDLLSGPLLDRVLESGSLMIDQVDPETGVVKGYAGLARTLPTGVERLAVVVVIDYARELAQLRALSQQPAEWTIGLLTMLSLIVASVLRLYLDSRQSPLFDAIKRVSEGQVVSKKRFVASDEFADIGLALADTSQSLKSGQEAVELLTQQNRALRAGKRDLVDQLGRDFRPAVTSVQGYLDLLGSMDLPREVNRYVQEGQLVARGLKALSGDMLDASRLVDDGYQPRREALCVPLFFQGLYEEMAPVAKMARAVIRVQAGELAAEWVIGDSTLLRIALLELLKSLLAQMDKEELVLRYDVHANGSHGVRLVVKLEGRFLLQPSQEKRRSSIAVDHGIAGIPSTIALRTGTGRLFEKIGASFAYMLADGPQDDDCLAMELDVAISPAEEGIDRFVSSLRMTQGLDIFLVEPDTTNRQMCRTVLEREGHAVLSARTADEAEKLLQDRLIFGNGKPPSIIIVNLDLSDNASAALLGQLRLIDEKMSLVPVVGLTSQRLKAAELAEEMNLSATVQKPFDIGELIGAVNYVAKLMIGYKAPVGN